VHPPLPHQALLTAAPGSTSAPYYDNSASTTMQPALNPFLGNTSTPPSLPMALHTMVPLAQYQGGDWFMDTGASGHTANNPGIVSSTRTAPSTSHIIVGNGAPLPVRSFGSTTIPSIGKSLSLNNVMISPGLIKNLISVRSFTRDNWVSVEFDLFGFSIKDLQTKTVLLRCDSTGDLYPLCKHNTSNAGNTILATQLFGDMWHARFGHPQSWSSSLDSSVV
jgi:hypothetical protein